MATEEDYAVIRWLASPDWLSEDELAWLLLHESRPLATGSREMLLGRDFRYTTEDRTVVAYDAALVIEPDPADEDVEFLLEFANAQLLELEVLRRAARPAPARPRGAGRVALGAPVARPQPAVPAAADGVLLADEHDRPAHGAGRQRAPHHGRHLPRPHLPRGTRRDERARLAAQRGAEAHPRQGGRRGAQRALVGKPGGVPGAAIVVLILTELLLALF